MRRLCKVITTDNERKIPVAATHSTAAWTAENAAYTESNPMPAWATLQKRSRRRWAIRLRHRWTTPLPHGRRTL